MRSEKKLIVDELSQQIGGSPFVLLADYAGLTVTQFAELRKRLRACRYRNRRARKTMRPYAADPQAA